MELKDLKGMGPKTIEYLHKLNIFCVEDLVEFYPYRYQVYQEMHLKETNNEQTIMINATIESTPKISYIKRNFNRLSFKALSDSYLINVTIFNRGFLYKNLEVGKEIFLIGKYNVKKNSFIASTIKLSPLKKMQIEPIYHKIQGLKNKQMHDFILQALQNKPKLEDYIPFDLQEKYHFLSKEEALQEIHTPKDAVKLKQAKLRLIYEELFVFMLKINFLKVRNQEIIGISKEFPQEKIEEFITHLPFSLTKDQIEATKECLFDLKSKKKMNRLLEGDVGCGKTIVATILMYACFLSGYQSALMAPTEILAKQHFQTINDLLAPYQVRVALLIGGQTKKEHNEIISRLQKGAIDIVIGTHALISEDVLFSNLGLVITDEQHRFGVNQRKNLQNKGREVDTLYMSATPIPRTYALTIYQDMETSLIKTKPSGRKEIKTYVKKESELKSVLMAILEEIKKGHQIYVVAPSINDEESDKYDVDTLKKKFDDAFLKKVKIEVVHGKMNSKEKEGIMQRFINGETKILIATTVIEVGVDVKNATTMVIFNAEMFGLATLHQLRGRVGRNEMDSYCYLISNEDNERLKVLEQSNDGFYISEQDFLMRKEGDLFGTRQSGDMSFKIADLKRDFKIVLQAKKDSATILEQKNQMEEKYKKVVRSVISID